MIEQFSSLQFWITLGQIVAVNVALSGNNAVVIAFAARSLPIEQRRRAIFWGSLAAIALRLTLTVVVFEMLRLPFMKIVGGVLLLWIAVQLLVPDADDGGPHAGRGSIFSSASYVILIANLAMSLDNVLGVAAAAAGDNLMLGIGLAISILMIGFGSTRIPDVMARFPGSYVLCAALIGYLAGDMLAGDMVIQGRIDGHLHWLKSVSFDSISFSVSGLLGAAGVFPLARLYHLLTSRQDEGGTAGGTAANESGRLDRFARDGAGSMRAALAGSRIIALLPFAIVIAVTFLGHPFLAYYRHRFVPQIGYYDLKLGMSPAEVIYAKGNPAYVVEDSIRDHRQLLIKFEEMPAGKTAKDYREWEFPIGGNETGSVEVIFSRETMRVIQIGCYSKTAYCVPIYGITTGSSEEQVMNKLGKPENVQLNKVTETFDYPDLHLSLLLEKKRVVMLMTRNIGNAASRQK